MTMKQIILLCSFLVLFLSCKKEKVNKTIINENQEVSITKPKTLLENVTLSINPKFKDWVLFENGTYIIFDDISKVQNIEEKAIQMMKEFGPASGGGPSGDFGVIYLHTTEGWLVNGHCYGMYTYVNPSELSSGSADHVTIGIFGRSKRNKDGLNPNIIHINRSSSEK